MNSIKVLWMVMAGLLCFVLWLQFYVPIANEMLIPYLSCTDNAIQNSAIIIAIVQLLPLILVIAIIMIPIMRAGEPEAPVYYR